MLKYINELTKVKEIIEEKFSLDKLKNAENVLREKALKCNIPYITYLRVISQTEDLPATARLLGIYLLYIN